ncbi:galactose-1-phosphate uridylyltransferase [Trichonephila clavata]|uniref:Galactose-1-phosphate uridylyltransferase n=1 Tax=Trichonephila clavata TaxID=2740835 RepID=A0A8X6KMC2_TRICU|nr:galactose-1-phosphate uridylyltransferase [Trichonephila clavata]
MTFGLHNAAQTFQRFMNMVLSSIDFVFCYLEYILVASSDEESPHERLFTVFEKLNDALCINVSKSVFGSSKIKYLGYEISPTGIRLFPSKVEVYLSPRQPLNCTIPGND